MTPPRPPGRPPRARRLAGRGFRLAARAGAGPAGRSGAAPRGVKVQTSGDGGKGDRSVGRGVSRSERSDGSEGGRRDRSVGCGAPRSEGANRRRRQGEGRGGGGRPGAAPHGVRVQAGGKGGRGAGRRVHRPGPAHAPARGWPYPLCRVRGEGRAGAGAPCAPREHPDYIYQRVVSPQTPTTPSPITQSGQAGSSQGDKSDISPPRRPCSGSGLLLCGLAGGSNPSPPARPERFGASGARSGPGCAPGNHRGALAVRRAPHPAITLRIRPGQRGVAVSGRPATAPGRHGNGEPATPARPDHSRPALPHPTDRPVPLPAFAARLSPGPVGRRAGPTGRCPLPPSLPA